MKQIDLMGDDIFKNFEDTDLNSPVFQEEFI